MEFAVEVAVSWKSWFVLTELLVHALGCDATTRHGAFRAAARHMADTYRHEPFPELVQRALGGNPGNYALLEDLRAQQPRACETMARRLEQYYAQRYGVPSRSASA